MKLENEPSAGDFVKATVLIIGCAASIAIGFTFIAAVHVVKSLNPFRK